MLQSESNGDLAVLVITRTGEGHVRLDVSRANAVGTQEHATITLAIGEVLPPRLDARDLPHVSTVRALIRHTGTGSAVRWLRLWAFTDGCEIRAMVIWHAATGRKAHSSLLRGTCPRPGAHHTDAIVAPEVCR